MQSVIAKLASSHRSELGDNLEFPELPLSDVLGKTKRRTGLPSSHVRWTSARLCSKQAGGHPRGSGPPRSPTFVDPANYGIEDRYMVDALLGKTDECVPPTISCCSTNFERRIRTTSNSVPSIKAYYQRYRDERNAGHW